VKLENGNIRAREGVCLHIQLVRKSCQEMKVEGDDVVTETPKYDCLMIGEWVWALKKKHG